MKQWKFVFILVLLILVGCASNSWKAPQFTLNKYMHGPRGPFLFQHGEKIVIGEEEWVIEKQNPEKGEMEAFLRTIEIPEIDFREAEIQDILLFLEGMAKPCPPEIRIVFKGNAQNVSKVTLSMRYASLYQALKIICELANLKMEVKYGIIIVEPK